MEITQITNHKKYFLDLLLLGDEQENMINRYLERGDMFALYDNGALKSICVVTQESPNTFELKNIATYPHAQGQGYATALIQHISTHYQGQGNTLLVGTGETPSTLHFYDRCGFQHSHRVKSFFTDHYTTPIFEEGIQLVDMIYLKKAL